MHSGIFGRLALNVLARAIGDWLRCLVRGRLLNATEDVGSVHGARLASVLGRMKGIEHSLRGVDVDFEVTRELAVGDLGMVVSCKSELVGPRRYTMLPSATI